MNKNVYNQFTLDIFTALDRIPACVTSQGSDGIEKICLGHIHSFIEEVLT